MLPRHIPQRPRRCGQKKAAYDLAKKQASDRLPVYVRDALRALQEVRDTKYPVSQFPANVSAL